MNSTKSKSNNNQKNDLDDKIDIDNANDNKKSEKVGSVTIFERFTQSLKTFLDNAE